MYLGEDHTAGRLFTPPYAKLSSYLAGADEELRGTTALLLWSGASYLVKDLLLQRRMRVCTDHEGLSYAVEGLLLALLSTATLEA